MIKYIYQLFSKKPNIKSISLYGRKSNKPNVHNIVQDSVHLPCLKNKYTTSTGIYPCQNK